MLKTDHINGPHAVLDGLGYEATLTVRAFYAGPGKTTLLMRIGRRTMTITIDAADLVDAVSKLVPGSNRAEYNLMEAKRFHAAEQQRRAQRGV